MFALILNVNCVRVRVLLLVLAIAVKKFARYIADKTLLPVLLLRNNKVVGRANWGATREEPTAPRSSCALNFRLLSLSLRAECGFKFELLAVLRADCATGRQFSRQVSFSSFGCAFFESVYPIRLV